MTNMVAGVDGCKAGWFMTPERQQSVFEIHPELCFLGMNNGQPMSSGKRTPEGMTARKELLILNGFAAIVTQALSSRIAGVAKDDTLDACAACWTARRIASGVAAPILAVSPLDSRGLRMEMWY
jgi:predicted RNase H-like nuclease